MANTNRPMGLVPISRSITGGPLQTVLRNKIAAYATRIRPFDVVNRVTDGSIERSITPGTTIISGISLNLGAASTATEHIILEDPFQFFYTQANGAGLLAIDAGANVNLVLGTTNLKFSDDQANSSTIANTATLDLKVHDKISDPDNTWGLYAKIVVQINSHRLQPGVLGV